MSTFLQTRPRARRARQFLVVVVSLFVTGIAELPPGGTPLARASEVGLPLAVDDSYSTQENTTLHVSAPGVLGNDIPNEGEFIDPLQAELVDVGVPTLGIVTLNLNGSFTYDPPPGFTGTDAFTYLAFHPDCGGGEDLSVFAGGDGCQDVAVVWIDVNAAPSPPSPSTPSRSRSSRGSSRSRQVSSDSSNCSGGSRCTVEVAGHDEIFRITASKGKKAELKAKLKGGRAPDCDGRQKWGNDWAQFFFAKGGEDRDKTVVILVRHIGDDDLWERLHRENVCFAAPYRFPTKDGFDLRRESSGEFAGILPDCDDLPFHTSERGDTTVGQPGRADGPSPCVKDRDIERHRGKKVFELTVRVPANDLDPRVRTG